MIGGALVVVSACLAGQVVLRGGGEVLDAPIEAVTGAGVEVGGEAPRVIAWDRIKLVLGAHADEASVYAGVSEDAWRARVRLARGDVALASGLFEELFERYEELGGPTALLVAEGTAWCRLAAQEQGGAVVAWLRALEQRRAGWKIAGDPALRPLMDEETWLVPALPPLWVEGEEPSVGAGFETDDPVVRALADIYLSGKLPRQAGSGDHAGVALAGTVLAAVEGDEQTRARARAGLREVIGREPGSWKEAWCRVAIGRSLMREGDEEVRRRGMLEMLHVPARFGRSQPYLAGLALSDVCVALAEDGDVDEAGALALELSSRHPTHPGRERAEEVLRAARGRPGGGVERMENGSS